MTPRPSRFTTTTTTAAAPVAALIALSAASCSSGSDAVFPDVAGPTERTVAGVVQGPDGPVVDIDVQLGLGSTVLNSELSTTTSSDGGGFVVQLPDDIEVGGFDAADLFVQFSIPTISDTASFVSEVHVRRPVTVGELRHDLAIELPEACSSLERCNALLPDLTPVVEGAFVSETSPMPPDSIVIDTTTQPGRTLLRFASLTANVGDGPLHVLGTGFVNGGQLTTVQRVWNASLGYADREAGAFVFHPDHDHIHLENFEEYRLIDTSGEVVATSGKVSFCLLDSAELDDPPPSAIDFGIFLGFECGIGEQAINPGFADYYGADLPDQWIDVTGVAPGEYEIEIIADPADILLESNEDNNSVRFPATIPEP